MKVPPGLLHLKANYKLFKAINSIESFARSTRHDLRHYSKRCYISGAITNRLSTESEAFECERDFAFIKSRVQKMGFIAVSPLGMCDTTWKWSKCMQKVVWKMLLCKSVYFMDNWKTSRGCRIEHRIAKLTGKDIFYESNKYKIAK